MLIFRGFIASGISRTSSIDEQAVLHVGAPDLDMVGQREAALERAGRDPAIDVVVALLVASSFLRPVTSSTFCWAVMSISSGLKPATASSMR